MTEREEKLIYHTHHRRYNFLRIWGKRYAHMKARHEGRATNFSHSQGKGLLSKEDFIEWCMRRENIESFLSLYFDWAMADFTLFLSPSIDRIDPEKGYTVDNIQWMSFGENCEKNHKDPVTHKEIREAHV